MKKAIIRTEKGDMTVEFYHEDAPKTVENFIKLSIGKKRHIKVKLN